MTAWKAYMALLYLDCCLLVVWEIRGYHHCLVRVSVVFAAMARYESCSILLRLPGVLHHRPIGRTRSLYVWLFDMCRLRNFSITSSLSKSIAVKGCTYTIFHDSSRHFSSGNTEPADEDRSYISRCHQRRDLSMELFSLFLHDTNGLYSLCHDLGTLSSPI